MQLRYTQLFLQVFKVEVCVADDSSEGAVETVGQGFIQPIDLKKSCDVINVGLVDKELPTGSLQGMHCNNIPPKVAQPLIYIGWLTHLITNLYKRENGK